MSTLENELVAALGSQRARDEWLEEHGEEIAWCRAIEERVVEIESSQRPEPSTHYQSLERYWTPEHELADWEAPQIELEPTFEPERGIVSEI